MILRNQAAFLAALVVGIGGCALALFIDPQALLISYLAAATVWSAVSIGALAVLMMSYLVRGHWTQALHKPLVVAMSALPVCGALFIPILVGLGAIYPWAADAQLTGLKAIWLLPWFFVLRTVLYFACWSLLALWAHRAWGDPIRMQRAASAGLIIYALTASFAGIDWLETLTPEFHSSGYGLIFLCFTLLAGYALALIVALGDEPRGGPVYAYGAILLSVVLLWAYLQGMQYIIIWAGNIPEEVVWYIERSEGGWGFVLIVLVAGQFLIPFFALLSARVRNRRTPLLWLAGLTLVMRFVESFWLAMPGTDAGGLVLLLAVPAAVIATGAVWLGAFSFLWRRLDWQAGTAERASAPSRA